LDQVESGLNHLREADIFLPELSRPELILLSLYRRGGFLILSNNYRDGTQALEQAREMAIAQNSPSTGDLLAGLDYRLAFARLYSGLPVKSIEVAEEALHRSRAAIKQPFIARALVSLSYANHLIGHSDLALNQARDGFQISEGLKNERLMGMFLAGQAQVELLLGQTDAALLHARQALELSRAPHLFRTSSHAYRILGDLFRYLGDFALAREMYMAGLDVPQPGYHTADIQYRLAYLLAEEGRLQDAFDLIQEAHDFSERAGFYLYRLGIMVSKATILQITGRSDEVLRLAEDCAVQATTANLPLFRCQSYLLIGTNLVQTGRADEARQKTLAVVQSLRDLHYPFLELGALRLLMTAEKASARPSGETTGRMRTLLDQLDANNQSKELRPLFEKYRDSYLQMIEAVGQ
jgi:tetratricopeptide (TPR) repeat protein